MKRLLAIAAASLTVCLSHVTQASGPWRSYEPASVTRVDVTVEDADGKPVSGLTQDDFEIWSDGQRRPIEVFLPASSRSAVTLVVLSDITASLLQCPGNTPLPGPAMSVSGRSAGTLSSTSIGPAFGKFELEGFGPADRVRVGSVGRRVTISARFESNAAEIKKDWQTLFDVPPVEWLGPSPIWDAVEEAAAVLANEPGHRAIVLITDGQASGNAHSHSEVSVHAALSGISVNIIAEESMLPTVPLTTMASHGVDPTLTLRTMADFTGGGFGLDGAEFEPFDRCFRRDPAPHFKRALERLHQAYVVGFAPQIADSKPHALDVRVTKPGMVVRARKIYRAGPGASPRRPLR